MRVPPPPPPHTHTKQTLGIHVRLSAPGFGAHRICTCGDSVFHFFSSAYFTEGPYGSICLDPKVVVILVVRLYGIRAG